MDEIPCWTNYNIILNDNLGFIEKSIKGIKSNIKGPFTEKMYSVVDTCYIVSTRLFWKEDEVNNIFSETVPKNIA